MSLSREKITETVATLREVAQWMESTAETLEKLEKVFAERQSISEDQQQQ